MTLKRLTKIWLNVNDTVIDNIQLNSPLQEIFIDVHLLKRADCRCPICKKKCSIYDTSSFEKFYRSFDVGPNKVFIRTKTKRIFCPKHGVHVQDIPFALPHSSFTKEFDKVVTFLAQNTNKTAISRLMRIDWETVGKCLGRVTRFLYPNLRSNFDNLESIGIDETSFKKGHSYITVVINNLTSEIVWVGVGHDKETLSSFFEGLTEEQRKNIKTISGDGAKWIDYCVNKYCPHALRTLDTYHVVEWCQEAINKVRLDIVTQKHSELKELLKDYIPQKGRPKNEDIKAFFKKEKEDEIKTIKGSTFALGKNPENLTERQKMMLEYLTEKTPKLMKAYSLKEQLRMCLKINDVDSFEEIFNLWYRRAVYSRIKPFVELAKKVKRHLPHLINTVTTKLTNSRIEGVNTKIKSLIRMCYGFKNLDNMFDMIFLSCNKLYIPLPFEATNFSMQSC